MEIFLIWFLLLTGIGCLICDKLDKPKRKKPKMSYDDEVITQINRAKVAHFVLNYQPHEKRLVTEKRDGKIYGYMR